MISVSLSEWIIRLQVHDFSFWTAVLLLALFLVLYGAARRETERHERFRLQGLGITLELYAAAESSLIQAVHGPEFGQPDKQLMLERLLACRAAPYLHADLLGQLVAYAGDLDDARLPLLLKTFERESDRLCGERDKLLHSAESPGWGYTVWKHLRPTFPFLFALAVLYLINWLLIRFNGDILSGKMDAEGHLNTWTWFGSAVFSLLLLYPALMSRDRPTAGSALLRIWGVFIALLFLLHLFGPSFAPYVLTIQLLLFLLGFRFAENKPRKSRPFVGHYRSGNNEGTSEAEDNSSWTTNERNS